jgi:hypothetical protein
VSVGCASFLLHPFFVGQRVPGFIQEEQMRKFAPISALVVFALGSVAVAQQMGPPKIIQIGREDVKVGKGAAHEAYEAKWTHAMTAKNPRTYLGMASLNSSEAWWITGYASLAEMEKENSNAAYNAVMAQFIPGDQEYVSSTRNIIARYREDMSYGVEPLGAAHGFFVRTLRVRPGHDSEYVELRKALKETVEKGHVSGVHSVVFQVIAGAPTGTYLVFSPFTSLAERDAPNEAMRTAMADLGPKINDLAGKAILGSDDQIFTFNPKYSNPSPDMVSAAPDFWKPKAAMAKAAPDAAGKPAMAAKPDKAKAKAGQ